MRRENKEEWVVPLKKSKKDIRKLMIEVDEHILKSFLAQSFKNNVQQRITKPTTEAIQRNLF